MQGVRMVVAALQREVVEDPAGDGPLSLPTW